MEEFCFHNSSSFLSLALPVSILWLLKNYLVSFFLDFVFKQLVINVSNVSDNFKLRVVYSTHVWLESSGFPAALLGLTLFKHLGWLPIQAHLLMFMLI